MSTLQPLLHREINGLKPWAREDPALQVAIPRHGMVIAWLQGAKLHSLG